MGIAKFGSDRAVKKYKVETHGSASALSKRVSENAQKNRAPWLKRGVF